VQGRVQGVGFRYSTVRVARTLGVRGTVSNRGDGGVAVEAEGERARLEDLAAWLRKGPPGAYVRDVQITWVPWRGSFDDFDVTF
jgi:acylphosphatase